MTEDFRLPKYPIREAAKMLKISVHTLRMYEREGLIIPFQKVTKHRLYSDYDIERLLYLRSAINEKKISIAGIKSLLSMIPCWQIMNCTNEDKNNCKAYVSSDQPCWMYNHSNNCCSMADCSKCSVYTAYKDCCAIKNVIREMISN